MARAQHAAYAAALAASGWTIRQAPDADDCPDSVFVEDTVVVCEDLAVLTRPGAPARRAEAAGVEPAVRSLGLRTACIEEPGVLDGGDVLQAGNTVYGGRGGRTNGEGIRQLRSLLAPLGRTVIAVPLGNVLHLKSAVTALPDGTFLLVPGLAPAELFPAVRPVAEEGGCHVVPLGGDRVLIAASAPRTAELLDGSRLHADRRGHQRVRETRRLRHLPERPAARPVAREPGPDVRDMTAPCQCGGLAASNYGECLFLVAALGRQAYRRTQNARILRHS